MEVDCAMTVRGFIFRVKKNFTIGVVHLSLLVKKNAQFYGGMFDTVLYIVLTFSYGTTRLFGTATLS